MAFPEGAEGAVVSPGVCVYAGPLGGSDEGGVGTYRRRVCGLDGRVLSAVFNGSTPDACNRPSESDLVRCYTADRCTKETHADSVGFLPFARGLCLPAAVILALATESTPAASGIATGTCAHTCLNGRCLNQSSSVKTAFTPGAGCMSDGDGAAKAIVCLGGAPVKGYFAAAKASPTEPVAALCDAAHLRTISASGDRLSRWAAGRLGDAVTRGPPTVHEMCWTGSASECVALAGILPNELAPPKSLVAECIASCHARGYGCHLDAGQPVGPGSDQMLSCEQACDIRGIGVSEETCRRLCDRNKHSGCTVPVESPNGASAVYNTCGECESSGGASAGVVSTAAQCDFGCHTFPTIGGCTTANYTLSNDGECKARDGLEPLTTLRECEDAVVALGFRHATVGVFSGGADAPPPGCTHRTVKVLPEDDHHGEFVFNPSGSGAEVDPADTLVCRCSSRVPECDLKLLPSPKPLCSVWDSDEGQDLGSIYPTPEFWAAACPCALNFTAAEHAALVGEGTPNGDCVAGAEGPLALESRRVCELWRNWVAAGCTDLFDEEVYSRAMLYGLVDTCSAGRCGAVRGVCYALVGNGHCPKVDHTQYSMMLDECRELCSNDRSCTSFSHGLGEQCILYRGRRCDKPVLLSAVSLPVDGTPKIRSVVTWAKVVDVSTTATPLEECVGSGCKDHQRVQSSVAPPSTTVAATAEPTESAAVGGAVGGIVAVVALAVLLWKRKRSTEVTHLGKWAVTNPTYEGAGVSSVARSQQSARSADGEIIYSQGPQVLPDSRSTATTESVPLYATSSKAAIGQGIPRSGQKTPIGAPSSNE